MICQNSKGKHFDLILSKIDLRIYYQSHWILIFSWRTTSGRQPKAPIYLKGL